MSFLDSVLSSLGTSKPSSSSPSLSQSPASPTPSSDAKPKPKKPVSQAPSDGKSPTAGTKRKAEYHLQRPVKHQSQMPGRSTTSTPSTASSKPRPTAPSTAKPTSKSNAPPQKQPATKPPPKGSFADLMAKAKDLQQNASTSVGTLKHQAAPKERLSKVERKKRILEARAKEKDARSGKKPAPDSKVAGPASKKREPEEPSYKGTSRPTQPAYKGTAGFPSRGDTKPQSRAGKRSRMDDYLGTDEEDEGDYADGYDDYYSESSDMEAGLDDVELEEASALKSAQKEDEKELQEEQAAKKAKMDRRKRLEALSSKR